MENSHQRMDENFFSSQVNLQSTLLVPDKKNKRTNLPSRKGRADDELQAKFDSRFADAATRQAAERGFFISPSKPFLLERCKEEESESHSLREIKYIHLAHFNIRTLGYIQSCHYLTVCILHNNYLTRFNALENCPYLIRLDLHSNQIVKLPNEQFWSQMQNLAILNLHDNGIGKLEYIQALSACPSLVVLTLYDTPLCLKHNYRHHTINSIWSLKALDHHVVGDDEIIEDAIFSKRFSAMNPRLYVDLCPQEIESVHSRTLKTEMQVINKILSDVNKRCIHGSPVVVIQRWVRGHLCRRKHNISYFEVSKKLRKLNVFVRETPGGSQEEAFNLDYDTYLKNRRPGSKTPSASTTLTHHRADSPTNKSVQLSKEDEFDLKIPPNSLHIDINRLEQNALRSFESSPDDHNLTIHIHKDLNLPPKSLFSKPLALLYERQKNKFRSVTSCTGTFKPQHRDLTTVQKSFESTSAAVGHAPKLPYLSQKAQAENRVKSSREIAVQCEQDDEIPNHQWRIHDKWIVVAGEKPALNGLDPMQDYIIGRREAGRNVREAEEYWHDLDIARPKPQVKKVKPPPRLKDQVSLATLVAVSKAYRDRDKSDNTAAKADKVTKIQQERMQAKQIVSAFKDEKRTAALNQRQDDRIRIAEAIQQADVKKMTYLEYAQERKERALQRHRSCHQELVFAADFGNQHMSVSNALIRHDRQAAKEETKTQKGQIVNGIKVQLSEQAELVRRYMEHKQLMRQMTGSKEKTKIETRILQEVNDRIMVSRQRVAGMKARKAAIKAFQHSIPATAQMTSWPLSASRDEMPDVGLQASAVQPLPSDVQEKDVDAIANTTSSTNAAQLSLHDLSPLPPFAPTNGNFHSPQTCQ